MKLTSGDKAVLFLAAGFLFVSYMSFKTGRIAAGKGFIIGICSCGLLFYLTHRDFFKNKNKKQ